MFEPRYKALVEDCLESSSPLAVWQLDPAAGKTVFGPGIHEVATAGRIAIHHRLPGGRMNVVVEGLQRGGTPGDVVHRHPHRLELGADGAVENNHLVTVDAAAKLGVLAHGQG